MARINPVSERVTVHKSQVSGGEYLRVSGEAPTPMTPFSYRIEGTCYGAPWSCHLTRSGAHQLVMELLKLLG